MAALALLPAGAANATLIDNGGGLIYDNDRNITWYNAPYTGAIGNMNWTAANTWAANLTLGGATEWRLPTAGPFSYAPDSELGHLYFTELGNTMDQLIPRKKGLMTNLQDNETYWSGILGPAGTTAWVLSTAYGGYQTSTTSSAVNCNVSQFHAMLAVHEGNVRPSAVPDGGLTSMLLGSSLFGLLGLRLWLMQ